MTSSSQRVSDTEGAGSRERARTRKLTFQVSRNPFRRVSAARRGTLTTKEGGRDGGKKNPYSLFSELEAAAAAAAAAAAGTAAINLVKER